MPRTKKKIQTDTLAQPSPYSDGAKMMQPVHHSAPGPGPGPGPKRIDISALKAEVNKMRLVVPQLWFPEKGKSYHVVLAAPLDQAVLVRTLQTPGLTADQPVKTRLNPSLKVTDAHRRKIYQLKDKGFRLNEQYTVAVNVEEGVGFWHTRIWRVFQDQYLELDRFVEELGQKQPFEVKNEGRVTITSCDAYPEGVNNTDGPRMLSLVEQTEQALDVRKGELALAMLEVE